MQGNLMLIFPATSVWHRRIARLIRVGIGSLRERRERLAERKGKANLAELLAIAKRASRA